jgi:hypothetical protein
MFAPNYQILTVHAMRPSSQPACIRSACDTASVVFSRSALQQCSNCIKRDSPSRPGTPRMPGPPGGPGRPVKTPIQHRLDSYFGALVCKVEQLSCVCILQAWKKTSNMTNEKKATIWLVIRSLTQDLKREMEESRNNARHQIIARQKGRILRRKSWLLQA